jgi:hypothetical protein
MSVYLAASTVKVNGYKGQKQGGMGIDTHPARVNYLYNQD